MINNLCYISAQWVVIGLGIVFGLINTLLFLQNNGKYVCTIPMVISSFNDATKTRKLG